MKFAQCINLLSKKLRAVDVPGAGTGLRRQKIKDLHIENTDWHNVQLETNPNGRWVSKPMTENDSFNPELKYDVYGYYWDMGGVSGTPGINFNHVGVVFFNGQEWVFERRSYAMPYKLVISKKK